MGLYCDMTDWLGEPDAEGPDNRCGDRCPVDTTETCIRTTGHDGWHHGRVFRWRRR